VLKYIGDFSAPVDWSGRRADSWGISGQGETPQEQSDEEAHLTPPGKRSAWSGNQQTSLTQPKTKSPDHLSGLVLIENISI